MNRHEEHEKESGERWLLTYADLITLLLAFFIILFAMSNVDKDKYLAVINSLGNVFGAVEGSAAPGDGSGGEINFPAFSPSSTSMPGVDSSGNPIPTATTEGTGTGDSNEVEVMEDVKNQVIGLLKNENLQDDVSVVIRQRGLVISINSRVLFASGQAQLNSESVELIGKIAKILEPLASNQICVEGHTDTDPINTYQFRSNWFLSSARANTVLELLLKNASLKPENMSSVGYGEFRPFVANDTPENKARNRRVNIVILRDDFNVSININEED